MVSSSAPLGPRVIALSRPNEIVPVNCRTVLSSERAPHTETPQMSEESLVAGLIPGQTFGRKKT
jgi:hypothetical protein